jgi:hypothetical protein
VPQIRAKQAAKPKNSPLPAEVVEAGPPGEKFAVGVSILDKSAYISILLRRNGISHVIYSQAHPVGLETLGVGHIPDNEAQQQLGRMRQAFHINMLRAFPGKSHAEISAEIDKACGAVSVPASEAPWGYAMMRDGVMQGHAGSKAIADSWVNAIAVPLAPRAAPVPASEAARRLHNAIMNLPCNNPHPEDNCGLYSLGHRDARHAAAELAATTDANELHFNAQRLRNVAVLVGLADAVPADDDGLDGARGTVLGQIAAKLRKARAVDEAMLRAEFVRQHKGRNLKQHRLRGTYLSAPIAALWNQHVRTANWLGGEQTVLNADRYLWLRDKALGDDQVGTFTPYVVKGQIMEPLEGAALDKEVDAARNRSRQGGAA